MTPCRMSSVLRGSGFRSAVARPMVGDTKTSMVRVDHLGWLVCDGRSLLKSEYRALYSVLGDSFGSVDVDHFNLPDAEGRVVGLIGQSTDNTWMDGDISGEETHTLVIAEMPSHRHGSVDVSGSTDGDGLTGVSGEHIHGITDPGHNHSYVNNTNDQSVNSLLPNESAADNVDLNAITGNSTTGITINPAGAHQHTIGRTGGSQPHNNLQPTIYMGNLFVFCGRVVHNVTDVDGISVPVANISYYPPSVPANRLY